MTMETYAFRRKRSDTTVRSIENIYGINLNARSDMLLGTLLDKRGFDSLSQLLKAYRGDLNFHPRPRRAFLSFHAEDIRQVQGFRLTCANPKLALDLEEKSFQGAVNSERNAYVRAALKTKIANAEVLICLIGNGTAWRDWVDWELQTAKELGTGICGIRLKGSVGRRPDLLRELNSPVVGWNIDSMTKAIEQAVARRS